jgi:hypothetical protein
MVAPLQFAAVLQLPPLMTLVHVPFAAKAPMGIKVATAMTMAISGKNSLV